MKDAPAAPVAASNAVSDSVPTITGKNLQTAVYVPAPGIEYEIAEGCIRTLKECFYDVDLAVSTLLKDEDQNQLDPTKPNHPTVLRYKAFQIITDGDPLPKDGKGVNMRVVGRAVLDFFIMRDYRLLSHPV